MSADIAAAPATQPASEALLRLTGIEKSFGGVRALQGADFTVRPGEIHALLGENGAGKSTLVKILAGVLQRDAGSIEWDGAELTDLSQRDSRVLGIRVIYQQLSTVRDLSVGENLMLGREIHRRGWISRRAEREASRAALARLAVDLDLDAPAGALRVAERQLIEIARALAAGSVRLLLMDEPTASLGEREVERLFSVIRGLRDEGICVVYISHKLDEVFQISQRITVLRDGRTIGTVETRTTSPGELIEMMIGRHLMLEVRRERSPSDEVVLQANGLTTRTGLDGIDLTLHKGEVVGVYGLMGSGRTELARALFGADPIAAGELRVHGRMARFRGPADGMAAGIGFVPEERPQASFPLLTIRENVTLAATRLFSRHGWVSPARQRTAAARSVTDLRVKTPSIEELMGRLSGGNQQKVILGRWLLRQCPILILDDPTAGVDVGAKDEIYGLIGQMTASGASIVMSSSELPELLALADRMIVLHQGRLAGTLHGEHMTQRNVLQLAVSGRSA